MWLLDKLLTRLVRKGQLHVTDHDGKVYRYGDGTGEKIAILFTDSGAALHVARHPNTGAGEAYMDGRLVVEPPHDIRDFVLFVVSGARAEQVSLKPHGSLRRLTDRLAWHADQFNPHGKASRNVKHHYDLNRQFYELFLDENRVYSMA